MNQTLITKRRPKTEKCEIRKFKNFSILYIFEFVIIADINEYQLFVRKIYRNFTH